MTIPGITLVFKRSAAQENALHELLAAQQNTSSPLYHQWLTPETFAARFGTADEDIAATETWLQLHGFHSESITRSRDRITFSGTAAQVQAAFDTELHHYRAEGELHFAPASDLSLPAELASVTAAVLHLSDFRPKPTVKVQTRPHPDYTTLTTQAHYLDPKDIYTMYDVNPYAMIQPGSGFANSNLAVVGQSYIDTSSSSVILQFLGLVGSTTPVSAVLVPGSGVEAVSSGDAGESEIDLEYASSINRSATFLVYVGANQNYDVFDALAFAIAQNIAPVVSISYGICESAMSTTDMDQGNALFEQASAQGQTLVAAAGDSGSTACALYTSSDGVTTAQQQAISVQYPADSPYVTAVGGTQMAAGTFAAGASQYWATASNSDAVSSLLSYVPETVWNEGSVSYGIAAGGGGASAHFPRPAWQSGVPGIPSGAYRLLPDVALQSSIESPGFLYCSDDPALANAQGQIASCSGGFYGPSHPVATAGGTSFAAPIFAGMVAILNGFEHSTGQGNINPILYKLASNPASYAAAFHDITSGTNACVAGVGNCAAPGESGYAATPGYDEAAGLGSIDFNKLLTVWPSSSAINLAATNLVILNSPYTAVPGDIIPLQIGVGAFYSPSGSTPPTGTVVVSVDGTVVEPSLALSVANNYAESMANYNFVAPAAAGSHQVTVLYAGDATHAPSAATDSVLVGDVMASGSFSVAAGNLTIANGGTGSTQVTVTPAGGYSGRVVWSLASSGTTGSLTACYGIGSPPVSGTSTTTLTIGVGSACSSPSLAERRNLRPLNPRASLKSESLPPWHNASGIAVYAGLLICGSLMGRKRRTRLPFLLAIALLTFVGVGLTGCGGGNSSSGSSSSGGGSGTTPPSNTTNYTVTLTGTDSVNNSITASTTFSLTVN
jgi:subtilase family serine protease